MLGVGAVLWANEDADGLESGEGIERGLKWIRDGLNGIKNGLK